MRSTFGRMSHDEQLADRVRDVVLARPDVVERKMFGGVAWMVGGNMACGVMNDGLIVRIPPDETDAAFADPHAGPFGRPGAKPMKGFVLIAPEGLAGDADLAGWVDRGTAHAASLPPK